MIASSTAGSSTIVKALAAAGRASESPAAARRRNILPVSDRNLLEVERNGMTHEDAHDAGLPCLWIGQLVDENAVGFTAGHRRVRYTHDADQVLATRLQRAEGRADHDILGRGEHIVIAVARPA